MKDTRSTCGRTVLSTPQSQLIFQPVVVFVVSTTGQGDEPENMKQFWKFLLRKSLPRDSLSAVRFSVLGLGDSSYRKSASRLYQWTVLDWGDL